MTGDLKPVTIHANLGRWGVSFIRFQFQPTMLTKHLSFIQFTKVAASTKFNYASHRSSTDVWNTGSSGYAVQSKSMTVFQHGVHTCCMK